MVAAALMLDGLDAQVLGLAIPALIQEWGVTRADLTPVTAGSLVGMAIGSIFISPLADRYGRRPIILLCLVLMTLGMFFSAVAQDFAQLGILRVATGLGIGGILFRTIHLFFIHGVMTGLVWLLKITTDPFHDLMMYWKAPFALMRGELIDPMDHVHEHNENFTSGEEEVAETLP